MRSSAPALALVLAACGGAAPPPARNVAEPTEAPADAPEPGPSSTPPPNATRLPSGLFMLQLDDDTERGRIPPTSRVKVRYRLFEDGARVDEGGAEGTHASWVRRALPPGLSEALGLMLPGQTWRVWVPRVLTPDADTVRVYEITVDEIISREVVSAPSDVAAPPSDAVVTASGLASRVIEAGTGVDHPGPESRVTVHYTGWTIDGRMFDSSIQRAREATFPLNRVIAGWTEGLQLMVAGEIRRFWIPADLAYGESPRPGAPAGMLVFDVELIDFE